MLIKKEFLKLTQPQKEEVIDRLIEQSAPSYNFFLMFFMAVVITALGLLVNSPVVVIGGMLVAPVLSPILGFSMGVVTADFKLIKRSTVLIFKIMIFTVLISFIISLLFFSRELTSEIMARTVPNLTYFFVALAAGIAGSYAFAKPKLSEALPGVVISVAILPPLVVTGIGISFLNWGVIIGSLGLFFINIISIIFATDIIFSLIGFYDKRSYIESKLIKEEKIVEKEKVVDMKGEIKEVTKKLEEVKKTLKDGEANKEKF